MSWNKFWQNKIIAPVISLLKQGLTPEKIALSIAFGITLGVFPVLGSTTLLCTLAVFIFRLNLPAIQLVNFLVYPLQILLMIPFFQAGAFLFNAESIPLSAKQVIAMINDDLWGALQLLWDTSLHAVVVWLLVGPIATSFLYYILTPVIRKLSGRTHAADPG